MDACVEEGALSVVCLGLGHPMNCFLFIGSSDQLVLSNLSLVEIPEMSTFGFYLGNPCSEMVKPQPPHTTFTPLAKCHCPSFYCKLVSLHRK